MGYILAQQNCAPARPCEDCQGSLEKARALFHRFHCFSAPRVIRQRCNRLVPKVLVKLGYLRGLIYSSDKGQSGYPRTYIHFMETPPLLACDSQGAQLYVVGGNYRVTSRGIEG